MAFQGVHILPPMNEQEEEGFLCAKTTRTLKKKEEEETYNALAVRGQGILPLALALLLLLELLLLGGLGLLGAVLIV